MESYEEHMFLLTKKEQNVSADYKKNRNIGP